MCLSKILNWFRLWKTKSTIPKRNTTNDIRERYNIYKYDLNETYTFNSFDSESSESIYQLYSDNTLPSNESIDSLSLYSDYSY
jgi:hypothetical protein